MVRAKKEKVIIREPFESVIGRVLHQIDSLMDYSGTYPQLNVALKQLADRISKMKERTQ